jgi:hypothetical protein
MRAGSEGEDRDKAWTPPRISVGACTPVPPHSKREGLDPPAPLLLRSVIGTSPNTEHTCSQEQSQLWQKSQA